MKRLIMLAIFFIAIGGVNATTTVDMNWNGAGNFDTHFNAGDDAVVDFWTGGSVISGEWHASDNDDNPYIYDVDTTGANVKAHVENGFIKYNFDRTDSKYGAAGQNSYTYIDSAGTGDLAWKTTSNYAAMKNCHYNWQSNNQIQATGNHEVVHTLTANPTEWAGIHVIADANTKITSMGEEARSSGYRFGEGCGCYTNAKVDIVGTGAFDLSAYAENTIATQSGITTDGFLNIHSDFVSGFQYNNFALIGN